VIIMFRSLVIVGALLSLGVLAGCNKAADDQAKASQAQAEANSKIAAVAAEANAKVKAAQAEADKKIAEAQASFMKLREDYRHATKTNLVDLDKKIAALDAKAMRAKGKTKAELEEALKVIRAARDRFNTNFNALEHASASSWDRDKANLDKESADLKALVDKA
jgi:hypothetical protein